VNEGDLVRAKGSAEVLKVARLHWVRDGEWQQRTRTESERRLIAECLLPPHDNPNRFENVPADELEKVEPEKPADAEAK
jgi:hypothetical protein